MARKRLGMTLSVGRLWIMGLPFRLLFGVRAPALFYPGTKALVIYECRRLWHRMYERDRLMYYADRVRSLLCTYRASGR